MAIPMPGVANPRRHSGLDPESTGGMSGWIPAFAGMTRAMESKCDCPDPKIRPILSILFIDVKTRPLPRSS